MWLVAASRIGHHRLTILILLRFNENISADRNRQTNKTHPYTSLIDRILSASSPRNISLSMSPGMNEGGSVHYYDGSQNNPETSSRGVKWKVQFAKPPTTAIRTVSNPVSTGDLFTRLNLDDEVVSSSLSLDLRCSNPSVLRSNRSESALHFSTLSA